MQKIYNSVFKILGIILVCFFLFPHFAGAAVVINKPQNYLGTVAYWTFDGGDVSGSTLSDRSGNGNSGTITGTSRTIGKVGQAFNFDGIDDQISGSDSNLPTGNRTMTAWFKTSKVLAFEQYQVISFYGNTSPGQATYLIVGGDSSCGVGTPANRLVISQYGDATCSNATVNDGQWHHAVVTVSGSLWTLYLDGTQVAQKNMTTNASPGGDFMVGADSVASGRFDGSIDDVRIYNRALSSIEVLRLFGSEQSKITNGTTLGLIGQWSFDEGSGSTVRDLTGQGNNGTTFGSPQWIDGKFKKALYFNGPSNNSGIGFSIPDTPSLNFVGKDVTFSMWIKPTVNNWSNNYTSLIAKRNTSGGQNQYEIYLEMGTGNLGFYNGFLQTTNFAPPLNVWTYITVKSVGNVCSIYANGALVQSFISCPITESNNENILVGYYNGGGNDNQQFYGAMDDLRIYNRGLSDNEIARIYSETSPAKISKITPSQYTPPVAANFTPTSISGLNLWLDPSSETEYSDGDPVSVWHDRSGNVNNANASGGVRPIYKTNILNGLPTVRFDGISSSMTLNSEITLVNGTVFAVARDADTSDYVLLSPLNTNQQWRFNYLNSNTYLIYDGLTLYSSNTTSNWTSWLIRGFKKDGSTSLTFYEDTNTVGTTAGGADFNVGTIGSLLGGFYNYKGDIAEILVYDSALSDVDRSKVETYLSSKYGI